MKYIVCLAALLFSGCVTTSDIVPVGKDSYMISGGANGGPAAGQSIIAATKAANAYCARTGKFMVIRNTQTAGSAGFGGEHSNLVFSCVTEMTLTTFVRPCVKTMASPQSRIDDRGISL